MSNMAKQTINLGTPNGRNGDIIRDAFNKVNQNFTELYDLAGTAATGLPDQTDNQSKFLTTSGTTAFWSSVNYETISNRPSLSTVAVTGDYNDLINKPFENTDLATRAYVNTRIDSLVSDAPAALDTLAELAAALNNNSNFASTITLLIGTKANSIDVYTKAEANTLLATKANSANLSTVSTSGSYNDLLNKPTLSAVAASGSYNDLTNKPILFSGSYNDLSNKPPLFSGSYNDLSDAPELDNVALSGSYNDLINTPALSIVAISGNYSDLVGLPTLFSGSYNDLINTPALSIVAISGNYSDLLDKPTNFTADIKGSVFADDSTLLVDAVSGSIPYTVLSDAPELANVALSGSYNDLSDAPELDNVALSGSYNDLSDRPDLTVYATETYVNTAVSNLVANAPEVLDTLNELAAALGDDANFATNISNQLSQKANSADLADVATSGSYTDLLDKPTNIAADLKGSVFADDSTLLVDAVNGFIPYTVLNGAPVLSTVATSGSYNDLIDTPTDIFDLGVPTLVPATPAYLNYDGTTLSWETVDLSGYATTAELNTAISALPTDISQFTDNTGLLSNIYIDGGDSSTEFDPTDLFLDGGGA